MSTSKPLYIYLQRPDSGEWVTVGRYQSGQDGTGRFRYAPSYLESDATLSIDPVNLPVLADIEMVFNAVVGNDDDHPRNHAVRYLHEEKSGD